MKLLYEQMLYKKCLLVSNIQVVINISHFVMKLMEKLPFKLTLQNGGLSSLMEK